MGVGTRGAPILPKGATLKIEEKVDISGYIGEIFWRIFNDCPDPPTFFPDIAGFIRR